MIRFIIAISFVFFALLFSYLLFPIEWIVGKINRNKKDKSYRYLVKKASQVLLWISGVKVTVIGEENIPDEAVLYVGNHRSVFDILILYARGDGLLGFVSKDSINKVPSLRVWMRNLYCLFLNREDMREGMKVILQAIEYVKQGVSMCIFPEGTRNKGEEMSVLPFKEGSFKIATKTGCPIVPVAMNRTADIFENHFPKLRKTHVILEYGKPIYPKELDKEELKHLGAKCQQIIEETLKRNGI